MARKTFFSFHYENDVSRAMTVRNSGVIRGVDKAGFVDKVEFEKIKRNGDSAIKSWIDRQLKGTSVTVVLIGSETLDRKYVQYEILESYKRGNAIVAIKIGRIKDFYGNTSTSQSLVTKIGQYPIGKSIWFDDIVQGTYDYKLDDGYNNLGQWIENAAKKVGK